MSALLNDQFEPEASESRLVPAYLRFVAIVLLAVGLLRAAGILGIDATGGEPFLDLDAARQAGSVTLVALDLFAATGLWLAAAWGPVIWAVAALVEIAMHTLFAGRFGTDWPAVFGHVALVGVFGILKLYGWWREYRA